MSQCICGRTLLACNACNAVLLLRFTAALQASHFSAAASWLGLLLPNGTSLPCTEPVTGSMSHVYRELFSSLSCLAMSASGVVWVLPCMLFSNQAPRSIKHCYCHLCLLCWWCLVARGVGAAERVGVRVKRSGRVDRCCLSAASCAASLGISMCVALHLVHLLKSAHAKSSSLPM